MKMLRSLAAIGIAGATFAAVACTVDVDLANKACPCGPEYVCDESRDICVTPAELATDGGPNGNDGGNDGGPTCLDDKCPCEKDDDCKDPARKKCLVATKTCVECLREPTDTCAPGTYCNEQNQCTLGCKSESECQTTSPAVPHCNLTLHQCVQCLDPSHCPGDAGLLCSPSGSCVEGCDLDAGVGCNGGKTCCGNFCLDLATDILNCGACDNKCSTVNGKPICQQSNCAWPTTNCDQGFRHCASGNTGCETNIRTDVTKCGSCFRNCLNDVQQANGIACNPATQQCTWTSCKAGFGDCDGVFSNGCDCQCGSFAGQICCPGGLCNFPGGKCVGTNPPKCQ